MWPTMTLGESDPSNNAVPNREKSIRGNQHYDYCCEKCERSSNAIDELTWAKLLEEAQLQKDIRHMMPMNGPRLAVRQTAERDASRVQLEAEEKQRGQRWEELPA